MEQSIKQQRREELYHLLGDLPDRQYPISVQVIEIVEREKYMLEKLLLDVNGQELVPAYLVKPKNVSDKLPVIIYNHAHGGDYMLGKDELLDGRAALQKPAYAEVLAEMGIASFCIDTWAFGERSGRSESEIFKHMLWKGEVMWGMMVYDTLRAIDYLSSREDMDGERIGTLGLSMGSTMAWWVAALDERIKVCIDLCCLTDYEALIERGGLDGHSVYYYVPRLLQHFSTSEINALIAPRAHLALAGVYDPLTPEEGLHKINKELQQVYKEENAEAAWQLLTYQTGHMETAAMRKEVIHFLKKWLL